MTPVLLVPAINRPDLLAELLASIDRPVRLLVVDNSPDGCAFDVTPDDAHYIAAPWNFGVAGSWNLAVRVAPADPFWLVANADTRLAPGDLDRLIAATADYGWVGMNGDWRVFGLTRETVRTVGLFDGNLYPIYNEDCDYEYRCRLAGVRYGFVDGGATHVGSAAIRSDAAYAERNRVTHAANNAYYVAKWGGMPRGGETYTSPFAKGGLVSDWTLDIDRLAELRW